MKAFTGPDGFTRIQAEIRFTKHHQFVELTAEAQSLLLELFPAGPLAIPQHLIDIAWFKDNTTDFLEVVDAITKG